MASIEGTLGIFNNTDSQAVYLFFLQIFIVHLLWSRHFLSVVLCSTFARLPGQPRCPCYEPSKLIVPEFSKVLSSRNLSCTLHWPLIFHARILNLDIHQKCNLWVSEILNFKILLSLTKGALSSRFFLSFLLLIPVLIETARIFNSVFPWSSSLFFSFFKKLYWYVIDN